MHKKGADGEKTKARKTRKATGKARGVFGASFDDIKKKRYDFGLHVQSWGHTLP